MFYNNVMLFQDGDGLECCFCSQIYYEEKFAKRFQGKFCYFQMAWISFSPIWRTMKVILQFISFFHVRAIWTDIFFFKFIFSQSYTYLFFVLILLFQARTNLDAANEHAMTTLLSFLLTLPFVFYFEVCNSWKKLMNIFL